MSYFSVNTQTAPWLQQKNLLDKIFHPKNYNKKRVYIFHMNPIISVSSRYNRTVTRVKLQRLQQHEQEFHSFQPGLVPVLRGNWILAPISNQKTISNWQTLEREKLDAYNGSSLVLKPELVDCLSNFRWVTQMNLIIVFGDFCLILDCLSFFFIFNQSFVCIM